MGTAASLRQLGLQARLRCPSCETTYEHPQEGSPREGLQHGSACPVCGRAELETIAVAGDGEDPGGTHFSATLQPIGVAPYRRPYGWPAPSDVSSAIMSLPEMAVLQSRATSSSDYDHGNSHRDSGLDATAHLPLDGLETPAYMRTEQGEGDDTGEGRHEQDGPTSHSSTNHNGYGPSSQSNGYEVRDPSATAAALVPAADLLEMQQQRLSAMTAIVQALERGLREELNRLTALQEAALATEPIKTPLSPQLCSMLCRRQLSAPEAALLPGHVCAICVERYCAAETIVRLPCLHAFHHNCLQPWLATKSTCPVCRAVISEEAVEAAGAHPFLPLQSVTIDHVRELSKEEMAEQMAILGVPWGRGEEDDGTDMAWALLRAIQRRTRTHQDDGKNPADRDAKCGDGERQEAKAIGASGAEGGEGEGSSDEKEGAVDSEENLAPETEAPSPGCVVNSEVAEDKSEVDFRTGLLDYMKNRKLLNTRGENGKIREIGLCRNEHDPVHWKFPSSERLEDKESEGGGRAQEESGVTFLTAIDD